MPSLQDHPVGTKHPSVLADGGAAPGAGSPRPLEFHIFVSNVRFWSMVGVVAIHSAMVLGLAKIHPDLSIALGTPFKFATIGFFVISGFLLGERVERCKPMEYFMRRFKRVFAPWSLWYGVACALLVMREFDSHGHGYSNKGEILWMVFTKSQSVLYDSAYWFIPNLLICIAILLMCRRFLHSLKFGLVLLAINLAYVVNIYARWFPQNHTKALFAFVFYLWLGSYAAQNFERMNNFLARIPATVFVATSVIAGIAAYRESHLLSVLNSPDIFNTLRLSNQVFSISVVLLIFKFRRATWPGFIDVTRNTFGIYLSHSIVLLFLIRLLKHSSQWMSDSIYVRDIEGVTLWIAVFAVTYTSCLIATIWLANRPSLQWMVGLAPKGSRSLPAVNVPDAHGSPPFPASRSTADSSTLQTR